MKKLVATRIELGTFRCVTDEGTVSCIWKLGTSIENQWSKALQVYQNGGSHDLASFQVAVAWNAGQYIWQYRVRFQVSHIFYIFWKIWGQSEYLWVFWGRSGSVRVDPVNWLLKNILVKFLKRLVREWEYWWGCIIWFQPLLSFNCLKQQSCLIWRIVVQYGIIVEVVMQESWSMSRRGDLEQYSVTGILPISSC